MSKVHAVLGGFHLDHDGAKDMNEGSHGIDRLRSKTTLREILEVATEFEASARDFYSGLIPKVSKRIRYLVEELAAEEQAHFDLFSALARRVDIAEQVKAEIERTASDSKFSDCLHLPDLGEQPDDQAVLQYAMGREHAAMQHYGELADTSHPARSVNYSSTSPARKPSTNWNWRSSTTK